MTEGQSSSGRRGTLCLLAVAVWCFVAVGSGRAESLTITTLAGPDESPGAIDATGGAARFWNPSGVAVDRSGNVYVADNYTIRRITPGGAVSTFAGLAGRWGSADGAGAAARFYDPLGVAVDGSGNVYVADTQNHTIRKIAPAGVVSTLAGLAGSSGSADGTGSAARFYQPSGVAVDDSGNVYVADWTNTTIRKITPAGVVSTLAGLAGSPGSADGTGSAARFNYPSGVAVDGSGNVYVADYFNYTIRKITPMGIVSTLAGTAGSLGSADGTGSAARFNHPSGVTVGSSGNVYVADYWYNTIRQITPAGVVSTLAGLAGTVGSADGTGSAARFNSPYGVAVDGSGNVYVADQQNQTIRQITSAAMVSTLAGLVGSPGNIDGTGSAARFNSPSGVAVDGSSNVYVADLGNSAIRKITPTGVVSTLAWEFSGPSGVAVDGSGNVYVADEDKNTIRKITPGGLVSTLAGLAGNPGSADGTGSAARFNMPWGVAVDCSGNVYVADTQNHTIRKIAPAGVVSTLAGLAGSSGSADGTGSAARFYRPYGVAVDDSGNVYVADTDNWTIRKITPAGIVSTLAGLAGSSGSEDGTGSAARFHYPYGVAVDSSGNVYVADWNNCTIRKITPAGVVTTLAGLAGSFGNADGTGSAARFYIPYGVAAGSSGSIYIADSGNNTIRKGSPSIADVATIDQALGDVGATRQLDTDPQTAIVWQWSEIRVPAGSSAALTSTTVRNPAFTPDVVGLYVFRLVATDASGSQSITTVQLAVVGPASTLLVSGFPSPTKVGAAGNVTVTAQDTLGDTATGYTGTVHFSSSDTAAVLPGDYKFRSGDAGVKTFAVTLNTVGTQSITATDNATSTIAGTQSGIAVCTVLQPVITSPATANGDAGQAFSYQITATNNPTSFDAYGLPSWASVNTSTGLITGMPPAAGVWNQVYLDAINAYGVGQASLTIGISSNNAPPVISSPTGLNGTAGQACSYQITAINYPTSFDATGLPSWASINTSTGLITGTPYVSGWFGGVNISATNAYGTGSASLGVYISPGPAAQLVASGFPSPVTAGTPGSLSVAAVDAWGNHTYNYTGTVTITSSDASAILPTSGPHGSFLVTLNTVGIQSITATDTANGAITGTQSGIVVGLPTVSFGLASSNGKETVPHPAIPVSRNPAWGGSLAVDYAVSGGTAISGVNYMLVAGTLTLAPRSTAALHNFGPQGNDGNGPNSVIEGSDGVFYGTTQSGGSANVGTVFKLSKDGSGYAVLHNFGSQGNDGWEPNVVVEGSDGALYGTSGGGSAGSGTVFRLNKDGSGYVVLYNFGSQGNDGNGPDSLIEGSDGALYGTTLWDDWTGAGTVFRLNKDGSGYALLYHFGSQGNDGREPNPVVEGSDGALYGTTNRGGSTDSGTVFKVSEDGSGYAVLYNFGSQGNDGWCPNGALVEGSDGALYGTTYWDDWTGAGTVFRLNKDGSGYAVLHNFGSQGNDGWSPNCALVEGSDGALYGTTQWDGWTGNGTVFRLSKDGSGYVVLYNFQGGDGKSPNGLVKGSDGAFYGTTDMGGSADSGTLVKFIWDDTTKNIPITILHDGVCTPDLTVQITLSNPSNAALGATSVHTYTIINTDPAGFALALSSPQMNGVAFTGPNTLTAQDALGNTVTTFDASVDSVTIVANAPLVGDVYGLGTANNNVLNRATDFVAGVADLTALGIRFVGNYATGTFTATSATGKSGTSGNVTVSGPGQGQPGKDMQVVAWLTIPASVAIAWGAGTTGKSAGDVAPLHWTVQDAAGSQLGHGETCVSNDANNNLAMNLENTSNTGTNARAFAAVANSGGWSIANAPATDTFAIKAQLGTNPQATLAATAQELTDTATLAKGADQPLVMTVMTPTDITRDGGVQKTLFVVLTATPE